MVSPYSLSYIYIHTYIHTYIYIHTCMCVYIYIHTHIFPWIFIKPINAMARQGLFPRQAVVKGCQWWPRLVALVALRSWGWGPEMRRERHGLDIHDVHWHELFITRIARIGGAPKPSKNCGDNNEIWYIKWYMCGKWPLMIDINGYEWDINGMIH